MALLAIREPQTSRLLIIQQHGRTKLASLCYVRQHWVTLAPLEAMRHGCQVQVAGRGSTTGRGVQPTVTDITTAPPTQLLGSWKMVCLTRVGPTTPDR